MLALARGVLGAQEAAVIITFTVGILVSYGAAALAGTVQAVIFRRLLAWREGSTLPALSAHRRSRSIPTRGRSAGGMGKRPSSPGMTHFSAWPSRGRGRPLHLRQAKTGISRWNFS